jgi:hypothetical protein
MAIHTLRALQPEACWHSATSPALHESVATVFDDDEQASISSAGAASIRARVLKNVA